MKVCITARGKNPDGLPDLRFGRAPGFIFMDPDGLSEFKYLENPGVAASHGAGIQAGRVVMEEKPDAVLTGNLGPNAGSVLENAGIRAYSFSGMEQKTIREIMKEFSAGRLPELSGANVGSHFGSAPRGAGEDS